MIRNRLPGRGMSAAEGCTNGTDAPRGEPALGPALITYAGDKAELVTRGRKFLRLDFASTPAR